MTHIDLFSGIGGFSLAADRVWGKENITHIFCDNDEFCQQVIRKHWPEAEIYGDIRTLTNTKHDGRNGAENPKSNREGEDDNQKGEDELCQPQGSNTIRPSVELLTGGFPCQPFSQAGRRKGTSDNRFKWPEMLRVIREYRPRWVIGENVAGLLTIQQGVVFEQVCTDLEKEGYEVQAFVIPAVAVNAPHRRDRVWIVGHAEHDGFNGSQDGEGGVARGNSNTERTKQVQQPARPDRQRDDASDPESTERKRKRGNTRSGTTEFGRVSWTENWLEVATRLCRVDDGLPRRMDRNPRLKALGNAIVPQVAEEIFKAIKDVSPLHK